MSTERDRQRFELALSTPNPGAALHELAKSLKADGRGQVAMYHLFAEFQQKTDDDDPRHDRITDIMDMIWGGGWAKGRALFETELTDADIAKPDSDADRPIPR